MNMLASLYFAPVEMLMHLPSWLGSVLFGLQLSLKIGLGGWVLARTGRSPLWVLLLLVPYLDLAMIWLFAYAEWPAERLAREAAVAHQGNG